MSPINRLLRPSEALAAHRAEVVRLLADHGATNPRVFGSVARGADTSTSDVELLVTVDPSRSWEFVDLAPELERLLGVRVDVVSDRGLKPRHKAILDEATAL